MKKNKGACFKHFDGSHFIGYMIECKKCKHVLGGAQPTEELAGEEAKRRGHSKSICVGYKQHPEPEEEHDPGSGERALITDTLYGKAKEEQNVKNNNSVSKLQGEGKRADQEYQN